MYEPVFASVPTVGDEWWARIRQVISGWYDIPTGAVAQRTAECDGLERELELEMSPSIREWSSLHHGLASATYGNVFRDDYDFGWHPELDAVTLMMQAEGDRYWGVTSENLSTADPPVSTWRAFYDRPGWNGAEPYAPSLSEFALNTIISHLYGPAGGFLAWTSPERAHDVAADLTEAMETRLDLQDSIVFEDVDAIVRIRPSRLGGSKDEPEMTVTANLRSQWRCEMPQSLMQLGASTGSCHGYFRQDGRA